MLLNFWLANFNDSKQRNNWNFYIDHACAKSSSKFPLILSIDGLK